MIGRPLVAAAAGAAILLAAGPAQPYPEAQTKVPLLGIVEDRAPFETLVRLDSKRVRPVKTGRRVDLGFASYTWTFSPDRARIAFGRKGDNDGVHLDSAESFLRIVDPQAMREVGEVPLGRGILQESPGWLSADRIAAVKVAQDGAGSELVVADPVQARVLERRALPFGSVAVKQSGTHYVVLASSRAGIGPIELIVVDADGAIRSVVLDRISGGCVLVDADPTTDEVQPGLALTRDGSRAFVISADGLTADVDLASLGVVYHRLSLGSPTVMQHKLREASFRSARMLSNGLIALTGSDVHTVVDHNGQEVPEPMSAGLWLIDPARWTVRLLDRYADSLSLSGALLLVTGWQFHHAQEYATGTGLTAYSLGGKRLFRLFRHKSAEIWGAYGTHAFVLAEGHKTLSIVNLSRHRITGSRKLGTFPVIVTP